MKTRKTRLRLYARELCDARGFDGGSGVLGLMFDPWGFHDVFDQLFAGLTDDETYLAESLAICSLVEGPLAAEVAERDGLTFEFRWRSVGANPFRAEQGSVRTVAGDEVDDAALAGSTTWVDVSCHELYRALVAARDEVLAERAVAV